MTGFILGALAAVEQAITNAQRLRDHFRSFKQNEKSIQQLLIDLHDMQYDLKQLHDQLKRFQSHVPEENRLTDTLV